MAAADNPREQIAGDRRADRRYRLSLDLWWKLVRRRKVMASGQGRTVDLSSGGILFVAGHALPVGIDVEMSISWPALFRNRHPMRLVALGRIVRSDGNRVAIRLLQHEFQSAAEGAEIPPSALSDPLVS